MQHFWIVYYVVGVSVTKPFPDNSLLNSAQSSHKYNLPKSCPIPP
jgi:hypothetical protein